MIGEKARKQTTLAVCFYIFMGANDATYEGME